MTEKDLPALRTLAANGQIEYTKHGTQRMLERGYFTTDVEKLLSSITNQIVETQPPCMIPGRAHKDTRYVISDPFFKPETAAVISLDLSAPHDPRIIVITVEPVLPTQWNMKPGNNPWLKRK